MSKSQQGYTRPTNGHGEMGRLVQIRRARTGLIAIGVFGTRKSEH